MEKHPINQDKELRDFVTVVDAEGIKRVPVYYKQTDLSEILLSGSRGEEQTENVIGKMVDWDMSKLACAYTHPYPPLDIFAKAEEVELKEPAHFIEALAMLENNKIESVNIYSENLELIGTLNRENNRELFDELHEVCMQYFERKAMENEAYYHSVKLARDIEKDTE